MQFILKKELKGGRYFVWLKLSEYTEEDNARTIKFGIPTLDIRYYDGSYTKIKISKLDAVEPFGFYNQEEADKYINDLKIQIEKLKNDWNSLKDNWSDEEIL